MQIPSIVRKYLPHSLGLIVLIALSVWGIRSCSERETKTAVVDKKTDTLRVATLSGATTYFTIQDEQMGYQYELIRLYAESEKRPLSIVVAPSLDSLHILLREGKADLSITPEAVTREQGKEPWRYTGPTQEHSIVLVQRAKQDSSDTSYIDNVTGLVGKAIYLLADSHYELRMRNLGEQLGARLDLHYLSEDDVSGEDLIARVATDSIDYAIVDSELAHLAHTYYPNIDYRVEVGFAQRLRWITTPQNEELALSIDEWAKTMPKQAKWQNIYKKYFELYKVPVIDMSDIYEQANAEPSKRYSGTTEARNVPIPPGQLSPYDRLFQSMAHGISWGWQLLASIAYQESSYQADIVAWSGARGLMGIMPSTGRAYGIKEVDDLLNPENSVFVSVRVLQDLEKSFSRMSSIERLYFCLGSYNAGIGHIQDAQRLTEKYGGNPNSWADVEQYVLLLSDSKYYSDPVCKFGYLRGKETYNYVREVSERYRVFLGRK